MASETYGWRSYLRELRRVERDWQPRLASGIQYSYSVGRFVHGVVTTANSGLSQSGIVTAMHETAKRVATVEESLERAKRMAFGKIVQRLQGVSIANIEDILENVVKDIALYVGGSTTVGATIGAGVGAFGFGVGAIPGAAVGGAVGAEVGNFILAVTGLKSVAVFMKDAVPVACKEYAEGFRYAWGSRDLQRKPNATIASAYFAQGHVIFLMALLMGIVAYLTKGKGDITKLLAEVRNSAKLGPKVATWLEQNQNRLLNNPELRKGLSASSGGAGDAGNEAANNIPRTMRGQPVRNAVGDTARPPSVWDLNPTDRGNAIEEQLAQTEYRDWFNIGQENNGKFPLVDFQNGNNLVSLKSVDTNGSSWMQRMKDTIDQLRASGAEVDGNQANMILDLRVQPGGLQDAAPLVQYGQAQQVTVIIKEFP